jgi:hypothetical protein
MRFALVVALLSAAAGGEVTLTGTVNSVKAEHPNGTSFNALVLAVEKPVESKSDEGTCKTDERKEVQLAGTPLPETLVGKKVEVTGETFCEHTAWHVRPVLIDVKKHRVVEVQKE